MKSPLVSIVTPSFNQAAFLDATIQSVLHQDYPHLEYIIVDGGSTDESVDVIRKNEQYLSWWVSEKDDGQAHAINKGMARAKGDIVAWLNSDDMFLPGAIQNAVQVLESDPALGMVYGDALVIDHLGNPINSFSFDDWGYDDLLGFRMICQPAVFIRRECWLATGGLNQSLHTMLDHDLWLRISRMAPIRHSREIWAAARHHNKAKNVLYASGFAEETALLAHQLLESSSHYPGWSDRVEELPLSSSQKRHLKGGSYRLQGRYYLDGGLPLKSLRAYALAFCFRPIFALQHWHRIIYALLSLLGLSNSLKQHRNEQRRKRALARVRSFFQENRITSWIGINLVETPSSAKIKGMDL